MFLRNTAGLRNLLLLRTVAIVDCALSLCGSLSFHTCSVHGRFRCPVFDSITKTMSLRFAVIESNVCRSVPDKEMSRNSKFKVSRSLAMLFK